MGTWHKHETLGLCVTAIGILTSLPKSWWIYEISRNMDTFHPLEIACVFTCLHWRHLSPSPWGVGQATSENQKTNHLGWLGMVKTQVFVGMIFIPVLPKSPLLTRPLWRFPILWARDCKLACLPPGAAQKQYLERTSRYVTSRIQWSWNLSPESSNMEPRTAVDDLLRDDFGMLRGCSVNVQVFHGCRSCKSIQYSDALSTHELQSFTTLK